MRYEAWLATRYLFSQRRDRFVRLVGAIAVGGVALGVAALIVVLAVMTGFDRELEAKIIGTNAHIVVEREGGIGRPVEVLQAVRGVPGVAAGAPFLTAQVMLQRSSSAPAKLRRSAAERDAQSVGVVLRGVDPEAERGVTDLARYLIEGRFAMRAGEVLIGAELARRLGLWVGDEVAIVAPLAPRPRYVTVAGLFASGMYEFDASLVLAPLPDVQALVGAPGTVGGIGVRLARLEDAPRVKQNLAAALGPGYLVRTWMDLNANLFGALKLEKTVMFLILALIVLVASCNIVSTLIMTVLEKVKDIGILQAIGATRHGIRLLFTCQGLLIGALGTALGVGGGVALCVLLERYRFIQLPQDIYYIDHLPVAMQWADIGAVVVAAAAITLAATIYPAWLASRLQPVEALRYE